MLKSIIHDPHWLDKIDKYFQTGIDPDWDADIECHSANEVLYIYEDRDTRTADDCWVIRKRDNSLLDDPERYVMLTARGAWIAFYIPDYFNR